jgi:hypothetical protein
MKTLDFNEAIRAALTPLGIKGQVDVRMNGNRSTFWIGKPGGDDLLITIEVKDYPQREV